MTELERLQGVLKELQDELDVALTQTPDNEDDHPHYKSYIDDLTDDIKDTQTRIALYDEKTSNSPR